MLLNALNTQCPGNLPEPKAIERSPPIGMSDLFVGILIFKRVLVCPECDESTITTPFPSHAQSAVKDEYPDSVLVPFNHIPRPANGIHRKTTQPERSGYWTMVFREIPQPGITFCILEAAFKSESAHGRSAIPVQQFDQDKDCGEHQQGGNKLKQNHPRIIGGQNELPDKPPLTRLLK